MAKATKTAPKSKAKPDKKQAGSPRAAASKAPANPPEERAPYREILGVILFFAGVLLLYFIISDPSRGTGAAIVAVARGCAGALTYVLPVLLGWAGIVVAFSGRERAASPSRILLVSMLVLLLLSFVHLFSAEQVMNNARLFDYATFLRRSYQYQVGGAGVLGALLCWPLYRTFGVAGAAMILIALILINLILQRKISLKRIGRQAQAYYDDMREHRQERVAAREQRRAATIPDVAPRPGEEDDPFAKYLGDNAKHAERKARAEMRVEKIADDPLPGEPRVTPRPVDPDADDDIPEYLSGRKKRRVRAESLHVEEPVPLSTRRPSAAPPQPDGSEVVEKPRAKERPVDSREWTTVTLFGEQPDEAEIDRFMTDEHPIEPPVTPPPVAPSRPPVAPVAPSRPPVAPPPVEPSLPLEPPDPDDDDEPPFDMADAQSIFDLPGKAPVSAPRTEVKPAAVKAEPPYPLAQPAPPEEQVYVYPPLELLAASKPQLVQNNAEHDKQKADLLVRTLQSFGIETRLVGIAHGPTITRFELSPAPGVKVSRITSLSDDIALNLASTSVRIEAPIPGKSAVGVEVPNDRIETVPLRDVLESADCRNNPSRLAVALGRDNAGRYIISDLAKMPHTLIAGQTGSGKSVCVNCIICSLLYRSTPEEVRIILIDPKVVELSCYNGVPHLLVPVVTEPSKAASALDWAVSEMTKRYKQFADLGVRNIKGYNQHRPEDAPYMPQIVVIIDELADLMMVAPNDVEDSICRLAQLARAAGIYLVIATQRPSVDIITGKIKANIPSRIAFQTASQIDSRTILDVGGAEKLLGQGDMIYAPSGAAKRRAQGAWVSDDEVSAIVDFLKVRHDATYDDDVLEKIESAELSDAERDDKLDEFDELLPTAIELVVDAEQASVSLLQRRLRVGHSRAGRLVDEMEVRGIVGPDEGSKARKVLMTREQFRAKYK